MRKTIVKIVLCAVCLLLVIGVFLFIRKEKQDKAEKTLDSKETDTSSVVEKVNGFNEEDREAVALFWGIRETDYEIISIKNCLREDNYSGRYYITINVTKEQMDTFVEEVLVEHGLTDDVYMKRLVENNMKIDLDEENATMYFGGDVVKRELNPVSGGIPKTVKQAVVVFPEVDGVYEVRMMYGE